MGTTVDYLEDRVIVFSSKQGSIFRLIRLEDSFYSLYAMDELVDGMWKRCFRTCMAPVGERAYVVQGITSSYGRRQEPVIGPFLELIRPLVVGADL